MEKEEIPDSIKSPLSLKADYANPLLYGWASLIFGVIGLVLGAAILIMSRVLASGLIVVLSLILLLVGIWLIKRGE